MYTIWAVLMIWAFDPSCYAEKREMARGRRRVSLFENRFKSVIRTLWKSFQLSTKLVPAAVWMMQFGICVIYARTVFASQQEREGDEYDEIAWFERG